MGFGITVIGRISDDKFRDEYSIYPENTESRLVGSWLFGWERGYQLKGKIYLLTLLDYELGK